MTILIGGAWLGEVYVMPITHAQSAAVNPEWAYTCYKTPDAVINFLNTLNSVKAEKAKLFVTRDAVLSHVHIYCVAYWK
jgi:hypothetical protein